MALVELAGTDLAETTEDDLRLIDDNTGDTSVDTRCAADRTGHITNGATHGAHKMVVPFSRYFVDCGPRPTIGGQDNSGSGQIVEHVVYRCPRQSGPGCGQHRHDVIRRTMTTYLEQQRIDQGTRPGRLQTVPSDQLCDFAVVQLTPLDLNWK